MASVGCALLLLSLVQLQLQLHPLAVSGVHPDPTGNLTHHSTTPSSLCHPDETNALLKLKQSFFSDSYDFDMDPITTLPSWENGTDCCRLWEGVGCSDSSSRSGYVITALDLSGFGLNSNGIDPVLFNLTSLRLLDLSMNNFRYHRIPDGFERLSLLTHLNLSTSGIIGQVPDGISKLNRLVSLDLSDRCMCSTSDSDYCMNSCSDNYGLGVHNFDLLVANLSNLRELYFDAAVNILSPNAEGCFKALAESVPHLRVLGLENCGLQGHIDSSLSRLRSLVVINLSNNPGITPCPFPEFLMDVPNLRVLLLPDTNLEGWFPQGMFQSKNLRVLDLSWNLDLSGHITSFSNAASLETLRLDMTNFTYVKSNYFSNFKALTELAINGDIISTDFLSSFGMLASLRELSVTRLDSPEQLESLFSWFEGIKNLRSLEFDNCDLSMTMPSSIGNLKRLTRLTIYHSNLTSQTLTAVASISSLKIFTIESCGCLLGQLPSAIGNMSNMETLGISGCQLYGPIPHEIGVLKKLKTLILQGIGLSGRIPSSISNLTQLTELLLEGNYLTGATLKGSMH